MTRCQPCDRHFNSSDAYEQHVSKSPRHECPECYYHYTDADDLSDHRNKEHKFCGDCQEWYSDADAIHNHNVLKHSEKYCVDCHRIFGGVSQYNSHRNSSTHRTKDVICPHRSRGCMGTFISIAALTLHLEIGSCVSGFTRADVNERAASLDKSHLVVDPSRLTANGTATTTYHASDQAWNGSAWECGLCHSTMPSQAALNQHLNSPRHGEQIYLCPHSACRKRFRTLSGFLQHAESDTCGVKRLRAVKNVIARLSNGMRRITM